MTNEDFDKALAVTLNGDFFAISVSDEADLGKELAGQLIQFGTGAYAHIGVIREKDINMSVESVSQGTIATDILSYRGRKGLGITFWRLNAINDSNRQIMMDYIDKIVGEKHPYDWSVILRMTGRSLLGKIPVVGFFITKFFSKLKFWGDTPKELFCSEVCTMMARTIEPDFRKGFEANQVTPTLFCESSKIAMVSRAVAEPEA